MTAPTGDDRPSVELPHQLEAFLTRIPLFAEVDRVARAQLAAHLDPVVLAAGDTVCRQGEPGDCLYVVAAGQLGVHVHDPEGQAARRIDGLGPGDFFGEMALLTGERRAADVVALTDVVAVEIAKDALQPVLQDHPELAATISAKVMERRDTLDARNENQGQEQQSVLSRIRAYFGL